MGEKLGIFIEIDPSDLRPRDGRESGKVRTIHELPVHILRQ
jgi:hypothetical protein